METDITWILIHLTLMAVLTAAVCIGVIWEIAHTTKEAPLIPDEVIQSLDRYGGTVDLRDGDYLKVSPKDGVFFIDNELYIENDVDLKVIPAEQIHKITIGYDDAKPLP